MTAANYDLEIKKNATFKKRIVWRDKNKRAVNLTGYTAKMHIRSTLGSVTPLVELTTENGRIAITGISGAIYLEIALVDLASLPVGTAVYDLVLIAPLGASQDAVLEGNVVISDGVTRS